MVVRGILNYGARGATRPTNYEMSSPKQNPVSHETGLSLALSASIGERAG